MSAANSAPRRVSASSLLISALLITTLSHFCGYDVLFNSIAQQTHPLPSIELVVIDELARHRKQSVYDMALALGIRIRAITSSKPKTRCKAFGQYNAINSGALLCTAPLVTLLQDNVWMPPNFVSHTLQHFAQQQMSLLGYVEMRYDPPISLLNRDLLHDNSALSVFQAQGAGPISQAGIRAAPSSLGFKREMWNSTMTPDAVAAANNRDGPHITRWFECAACTFPVTLLHELNGVDEALDCGDDSQESNIRVSGFAASVALTPGSRDRAYCLGYVVYVTGAAPIELIDHHKFEKDDTWSRKDMFSNIPRWRAMKDLLFLDEIPLQATNTFNFSLTHAALRALPSPVLELDGDSKESGAGGVWPSFLAPAPTPHWNASAWQTASSAVMHKSFGYKPELTVIFGDYGLRGSSPHPPPPTVRNVSGASCERHDWPFTQGRSFVSNNRELSHSPYFTALQRLRRSFHITVSYCGESHLSAMNMAPSLIMRDMSSMTHLVLSVGAADGCAVHMAKNIMETSPQIKHAVLLQGSLSSSDDYVLSGFTTVFASSPVLHAEAASMLKDEHAVLVPAWMLPAVGADARTCSDSDARCGDDGNYDAKSTATQFYFDVHADSILSTSTSGQSSSSPAQSICFANEHLPHPLQQLQPCIDAGANAIVLLRLPLLVVDAISMAKSSNIDGPLRATDGDLGKADAHCMAAAQAALKNGLYMYELIVLQEWCAMWLSELRASLERGVSIFTCVYAPSSSLKRSKEVHRVFAAARGDEGMGWTAACGVGMKWHQGSQPESAYGDKVTSVDEYARLGLDIDGLTLALYKGLWHALEPGRGYMSSVIRDW